MRVAYVMPHSYEYMFSEELANLRSPNDFDTQIVANLHTSEFRYCDASLIAGIEPIFYYFSNLTRKVQQFTHHDGFVMRKVPVQLRRGKLGSYGWEYSLTLLEELSNDFDFVLVFTYALNKLVWMDMYDIAATYCRMRGCPVIARHGGGTAFRDVHSLPGRALTKKLTLSMAARIIVSSTREFLALKNSSLGNKVVQLYDPIDTSHFRKLARNEACRRLRKDSEKRYLLYVGRLERGKGIHHIINILPRLKVVYPNLVLLIVGYGDFRTKLVQQVMRLGLADDVLFEGLVFNDALPAYYSLADLLLLPSYRESFGNVLQEAVACQLPCVASDVGGIPDTLKDGVGILVPPRDETRLYAAVRSVLDGSFKMNEDRRRKLVSRWDVRNFAAQLKALYDGID